jgi:tRNA(His) guanylyltransferase
MAKSKYEYVKNFEVTDNVLPQCWIVVRVDGKGFTKFADAHEFDKPNDSRALELMDCAALAVVKEFPDIKIAYGESDEYSFVFRKSSKMYNRRASKLSSLVVSLFSASYVKEWSVHFSTTPLKQTPYFDARVVAYPNDRVLRDYLAWRQV